jgi:hypothetical protein
MVDCDIILPKFILNFGSFDPTADGSALFRLPVVSLKIAGMPII